MSARQRDSKEGWCRLVRSSLLCAGAALLLFTPGAVLAQDAPEFEPEPELQDYTSVSTKMTQRVQVTPASVAVITAEQIERWGFRSVGEALSSVPGLYVTHDLQNWHVGVRGILGGARSGSRTLKIMINGRPFSFVHSGVHYLGSDFVPMAAIERIEVMKGPASALYGAGALTGAINIVTKRPPAEPGKVVAGVTTSFGGGLGAEKGTEINAVVTLTTQEHFAMFGITGAYMDRSGLKLPSSSPVLANTKRPELKDVESANDLARPLGFFGKLQYNLFGGRLGGDFFAQFYDYDAEFYDLSPLSGSTRFSLAHWKAVASYERPFASGFSLLVAGGVASGAPRTTDRILFRREATTLRRRDFNYTEFSGQAEGRYEFANGAWVLGGFDVTVDQEKLQRYFREDRLDGSFTTNESAQAPPDETLTNIAGYLQIVWPIAKWLNFAGGFRYDNHSVYGGAVTARAAVVLPLRDDLVVKAIFGRSYKAPSAEQLYGQTELGVFGDISGDDQLGPQFLTGGELVVDYFLTTWLNFSASFFGNILTDGIAYVREGDDLTPKIFDATSLGGEFIIRQASNLGSSLRLSTTVAAALQSTTTSEETVFGIVNKEVPDNEGVPKLSVWARLNLEVPKLKARLFVDFRYIGERTPSQTNLREAGSEPESPSYMLGAYSMLNLGLATTPISLGDERSVSALFKVYNVLNSNYVEVGFNGVDVPALGTTAWLQLKLTL